MARGTGNQPPGAGNARARQLFINATNVHSGGGATLLTLILKWASMPEIDVVALLDTRMGVPDDLAGNITIRRVAPTILARMLSDHWLASAAQPDDLILCFGNLPPLFAPRCKTSVFVQNRFLVGQPAMGHVSAKVRMRLLAERLWLAWGAKHADTFFVQTPSMEREVRKAPWAMGRSVIVAPFAATATQPQVLKDVPKQKTWDFLYVASGDAHKNHERLLEAWRILADEGIKPSLRLTIDTSSFSTLCARIDSDNEAYGIDIVNLGVQPHAEMAALYSQSRALIFPSTLESFGLPLLEAKHAGLPVVAAELDYVRDLVDPEESFDPESALSIARAVKRFLGVSGVSREMLTASEFIRRVLTSSGHELADN